MSHDDPELANGLIVKAEVAAAYPLSHPNAFMGGQLFDSVEPLRQIVKARYCGPSLCIVTTEQGRVTVSPEHPILTARGWIPASELVPGDHVLHYCAIGDAGPSGVYLDQGPDAHDGFASAIEVGRYSRVVPTADDLHGAAKFCDPEIDVVDLDSPLWDHLESLGLEGTRQGPFSVGLLRENLVRLGAPEQSLPAVGLSSSGGVSGSDHGGLVLLAGVRPSVAHGIGTAWHRIASIEQGWYQGSVYDATTAGECYTVNGIVVANCRRALNPRPDIDRHIDRPIDSPADLPFPGSVQSPEAREDQRRFEEALRRQGEQRRQRRRRASRASRGGSRSRRPPRARREAARGQPAARGPALGGYSAAERDERGRRVARPDWGEKLGAVETPVEVLSGPSDRQIAMAGHTPGRGVAYATSDGRLFYVEYPPDIGITDKLRFDSAVGARLKTLLEEDRRALPRGMRGYPVIMSVQAPAVSELKLIQLSGNDVRVYADAGEGRIIHYHGEVHPQGVWHETGHSVMSRLNDLMGGEGGLPQTPPSSWVQAAERDRANLIRRPAFDAFNGNPSPTAAAHEVLELGGNRKLGQDFPGVTGYGATKSTEDWAEAWRLAILNDQQGYIALDGDREIRFEEMFPTRAQWLIDVQNEFDVEFPFSFDEDLIDEVLFSGFE